MKCSGLKCLTKDPDYRCTWCQATAHPLDSRQEREVQVRTDKLEVGASFYYLGDMLSAAGGCPPRRSSRSCYKFSLAATSLSRRGCVYSSCVWSTMLHASETCPLTKANLQRLQRNDREMIRQICNVKLQDIVTIRSNKLLAGLGTKDPDLILKDRRLLWYGQNAPMVQSRESVIYRFMESVGLIGPR